MSNSRDSDHNARKYYYRRLGAGNAWLKSDKPRANGYWISEESYRRQVIIHKNKAKQQAKARQLKHNMRRILNGDD
jgi:hypothetical protein